MNQQSNDPRDSSGPASEHDTTGQESIANLRPFGSLIISTLTGTKPVAALAAALDAGQKGATSTRRRSCTVSALRRSPEPTHDDALAVQVLTWHEKRSAAGFTDGRPDEDQKYLAVATNGVHLAASTNSSSAAKAIRKWIVTEDQGYVEPISNRVFRTIAAGSRAIAAWLRNTTPSRSSQFTAMAVAGANVGQSAVAADLSAYLAGTIRVEHEAGADRVEAVTVNADTFKLSFKSTDRIDTWCELVEVAFAWIRDAIEKPTQDPMLPGTAEVTDSLETVGSPYELLLSVRIPELPAEDQEEDLDPVPPVRFEIEPDQSPAEFDCRAYIADEYVGEASVRLTFDDDRWELGFAASRVTDVAGIGIVRAAVEAFGLEVHFASEHLYSGGVIAHRPITPRPFRRYDWIDFDQTDIFTEKPSNSPTEMRKLLGSGDDDSLFGWAVRTYNKGWLVCDDGANETADFIYFNGEQLALFPIKAAARGGRSTSTDSVHLVQAQAAKNLPFIDDHHLLHEILAGRRDKLVVFRDGVRQDNADEFLSALQAAEPASIRRELVVVQPQLQRSQVIRAHEQIADGRRLTTDLGMMRIDAMLRTLDAKCADLGVGFTVVGRTDPS